MKEIVNNSLRKKTPEKTQKGKPTPATASSGKPPKS